MSYVLCEQCRGLKKTSQLGGILKECQLCKGIGHIDKPDEDISKSVKKRIAAQSVESVADKIKKKRGRKPYKYVSVELDKMG